MSICVMVKVGEGLVLASDSASTISGAPTAPQGLAGPSVVKVFYNATKIFQIGALPVGVLAWGAGSFGSRTIASLVEEFENLEDIASLKQDKIHIKEIADLLFNFLKSKSDELFNGIPGNARPITGLLISGYSENRFFPEEYLMTIPLKKPSKIRPDIEGKPNFGANWYGLTDAIIRFHHGRDDRLFNIMKRIGISDDNIMELKNIIGNEIQYPVLFEAMPLYDAIEYARFIVSLVIARFRFVIGAEMCGGPIDIVTITRKQGFKWIKNKKDLCYEI